MAENSRNNTHAALPPCNMQPVSISGSSSIFREFQRKCAMRTPCMSGSSRQVASTMHQVSEYDITLPIIVFIIDGTEEQNRSRSKVRDGRRTNCPAAVLCLSRTVETKILFALFHRLYCSQNLRAKVQRKHSLSHQGHPHCSKSL